MTSEIEIYYYLKRMDEDLQDELKPKLKGYINLDSRSANLNGTLSSNPKVGIIHASQRNNSQLQNQISNINFTLIIFYFKMTQSLMKMLQELNKYVFRNLMTKYYLA